MITLNPMVVVKKHIICYTFTKRSDNIKVSIFYEVTHTLRLHKQKGEFLNN